MTKKSIRYLMIFLLINVGLAIFIISNYIYQNNFNEKINKFEPKKDLPVSIVKPTVVEPIPIQPKVEVSIPNTTTTVKKEEVNTDDICVTVGPFSLDEKGTMDFILNKNNQVSLAVVEKRNPYQIYWNLGKNKVEASALFEKQKNGAMSDKNFTLDKNDNGDWVVNIVKINASQQAVEKVTTDLAVSAQKTNAGGKWQFKQLPEGYFYTFKSYQKLTDTTIKSIDVMLKPVKEPC